MQLKYLEYGSHKCHFKSQEQGGALIEEKHWEELWIMNWTKYPQERHNGEEKSDLWKYKYGEAMHI